MFICIIVLLKSLLVFLVTRENFLEFRKIASLLKVDEISGLLRPNVIFLLLIQKSVYIAFILYLLNKMLWIFFSNALYTQFQEYIIIYILFSRFIIVASILHMLNIFIVFWATSNRSRKSTSPIIEEKTNGAIMLY